MAYDYYRLVSRLEITRIMEIRTKQPAHMVYRNGSGQYCWTS